MLQGATPLPGFSADEAESWLLLGYDHLDLSRRDVAEGVLVDVDALDDAAIPGAVHHLILRVLGLVQGQSQRFYRSQLLLSSCPADL